MQIVPVPLPTLLPVQAPQLKGSELQFVHLPPQHFGVVPLH
jgi:hypothetical protein